MQHNKETENLALLYAYGELDKKQEKDFLPHLKECPKCGSIIKITAAIAAALPEKQAPGELAVPPVFNKWTKTGKSLWETISHTFNFKKLVPAGAMILALAFTAVAAYKYGTVNQSYDFMDNMYAEINDIESDLDNIFEYFESL
jgi:anti-sigma factor ChrR (cupin superfamily)